jgi:hypothetical protein
MAAPRKKRVETLPSADMSTESTPSVYNDVVIGLIPALEEIVAWWQGRKATLAQVSDTTQETERITFHVERRWIEAIRRQADLDGLTITQVVNRAFQQHFAGK